MRPFFSAVALRRAWLSAALLAVSPIFAQTAAPAFSIPAKQIDITGAKYLKTAPRILLPTVNLEVMNWGKITSVTQTSALQTLGGASNSSARSTMEVAVPSDVAALRAIADELYQDLATKLRAAGWEVLTYEETKTDPVLSGIRQESVDPKLGAPLRKVNLGKQKMHYTIATPPGMPALDPGMTTPLWGLRSMLKDREAHALETTYRFDPVALQGQSRHGIGHNTASTNAEANLVLSFAQASFLSNKSAGGSIRLKNAIAVTGGVGEIKKMADASPHLANGISQALSLIAGGAISSKKGLYLCELDHEALKANLLLAGKTFNDEIVRGIASAR